LGIVALVLFLRVEKWRKPGYLYFALALCLVGYGMYALLAIQAAVLSGLVTTFPLIALSLAYVDVDGDSNKDEEHGRYRIVYKLNLAIALFFFVGMLITSPVDGGLQWGSRYLLPLLPSLIFAAAYAYYAYDRLLTGRVQKAFRHTAVALLILSLSLQLAGLLVQVETHNQAKQLQDTISALPAEVILTNAPFMPTHIASIDNKIFLYVETEEDMIKLINRLDEDGVSQIGIINLEAIALPIPEQVGGIQLEQTEEFIYKLQRP
jgi:hypothetical protein